MVDTDCNFEERHLIVVNRREGPTPDTLSLTRALVPGSVPATKLDGRELSPGVSTCLLG